MSGYKTFGDFLEQRVAASQADPCPCAPDSRGLVPAPGPPIDYELSGPNTAGEEGPFEVRSVFGNLFKNPFKVVNPARQVLPTNSRLLASPSQWKRLKGQVIGR